MASNSPPSSLARRVLTLPRRNPISRSGRCRPSWQLRRRLEVPRRAPCESCAKSEQPTKASRGSSRSQITPRVRPSGITIGTSFIECTAISALPSSNAVSSSFTKSPFPPTLKSGLSNNWSPRDVIPNSRTSSPGCAASSRALTCSACHNASGLSRVAITICSDTVFPLFIIAV